MKEFKTNLLAQQPQVVVFDLDGTLYDKRGLSRRMVWHAPWDMLKMQAERKLRASMKGVFLEGKDIFISTYYARLAKNIHCSEEQAKRWYETRYMPLMVRLIGKYQPIGEWVMPFVNECKCKSVKLVVLSDYGHAEDKLRALDIDPALFDWVVSAPELGGLKPSPNLMEIVAENMGVKPQECLVIGDREDTDGDMARAVGALFHKVTY